MPTSVSGKELPSPHDRTRALATGAIVVAIVVLIAVGLVWLTVGTIYLASAVGLELRDAPVIDPGG
jgi:hypothetical protein